MYLLTQDACLNCDHELGLVTIVPSQPLVTVGSRRLLVERDPEQRAIVGCPMVGPAIKPCTTTLPVRVGYSDLLRIEGRRVCLDTVTGLTDGSPPGTVNYSVRAAGQALVRQLS
jgi:hypothetical protein